MHHTSLSRGQHPDQKCVSTFCGGNHITEMSLDILQDLLIIPVNREDCSMTSSSEAIQVSSDRDDLIKYDGTYPAQTLPPEEDLIDVTWKLSYSSHTPRQLICGPEVAPGVTVYDFATTSERMQMIGHDRAEMIRKSNGVNSQSHQVLSDRIPF
jgi:hypothetical protein